MSIDCWTCSRFCGELVAQDACCRNVPRWAIGMGALVVGVALIAIGILSAYYTWGLPSEIAIYPVFYGTLVPGVFLVLVSLGIFCKASNVM